MDDYTADTKKWLEERFRKCDEDGIYLAHAPIYGYRKGHNDYDPAFGYACTYRIMRALSRMNFHSLLDVGGAEGYKTYVAMNLFGAEVVNSDLSEEACKRAEEIYNIRSVPADILDLPFKDAEFDVVMCSETLEHVADLERAVAELLRVAKKALIITVPNESKEIIERNIKEKIAHAHIHSFNLDSFDYLRSQGYNVTSEKMSSSLLGDLFIKRRTYYETSVYPEFLINFYNRFVPLLQKLFGKRFEASLIRLDDYFCRLTPYNMIFFTIQKDRHVMDSVTKKITPIQIMNLGVPFHKLKNCK